MSARVAACFRHNHAPRSQRPLGAWRRQWVGSGEGPGHPHLLPSGPAADPLRDAQCQPRGGAVWRLGQTGEDVGRPAAGALRGALLPLPARRAHALFFVGRPAVPLSPPFGDGRIALRGCVAAWGLRRRSKRQARSSRWTPQTTASWSAPATAPCTSGTCATRASPSSGASRRSSSRRGASAASRTPPVRRAQAPVGPG